MSRWRRPRALLASEPVEPAPAGTPAAAPEPTTPPFGDTEAEVGEPAPTSGEPAPTGDAPQAPAPAPASDVTQPPATQPEATIEPAKGGKQRGASAAATRTVAMRNIKFNPRNITIDRGDTVTWENEDAERHNAIGEDNSFDTPVIDQGETSQHTFNNAGTIDYFCTLHANMEGTITVRGSGGGGGGGGVGTAPRAAAPAPAARRRPGPAAARPVLAPWARPARRAHPARARASRRPDPTSCGWP